MRVSRWFLAGITVVGIAGSCGGIVTAEKIGRWINPPQLKWAGTRTTPGMELTASTIANNTITAISGQLSSQDGRLTASSDVVTIETTSTGRTTAVSTILLNGETEVTVRIKGQPEISARASSGLINWSKETIELKGSVSITSVPVGEKEPVTTYGDSAVVRWAKKLDDGQKRVELQSRNNIKLEGRFVK